MRSAAKIDDNQRAIVRALRDIPGVSVQSLAAIGKGCPDLLVGTWHGGKRINILMEIKTDKGTLTEHQKEWERCWCGQQAIVRTPEEAVNIVLNKPQKNFM